MNLVFHFGSALVFLLLGLWLVRLQQQITLLRQLSTPESSPVMVHWPERFFLAFAEALDIAHEIPHQAAKQAYDRPVRIAARALYELQLQAEILKLHWQFGDGLPANGQLVITTRRDLSALGGNDMLERLQTVVPGLKVVLQQQA